MTTVNQYSWKYKNRNIQPGSLDKYTRSDRVVIYVKPDDVPGATFEAVGFIQGLSVDEQKQLSLMYELGSSAPMIIPGLTQGNMSIQRMSITGVDFLNAIYSPNNAGNATSLTQQNNIIRSIRDIDTPFSMIIAQYPITANGDAGKENDEANRAVQSVLYTGCHIQSKSMQMQAGGVVIMENTTLMFTDIPDVKIKAYNYK